MLVRRWCSDCLHKEGYPPAKPPRCDHYPNGIPKELASAIPIDPNKFMQGIVPHSLPCPCAFYESKPQDTSQNGSDFDFQDTE